MMGLIHAFIALQHLVASINHACSLFVVVIHIALSKRLDRLDVERSPHPFRTQLDNLNKLFRNSEVNCHEQLRVNIHTFTRLCTLVRGVGLTDSKFVVVEEKVGIFLYTLAHHLKNRKIKFDFTRSGQTVSRYFNDVLKAVIRLQDVLLKTSFLRYQNQCRQTPMMRGGSGFRYTFQNVATLCLTQFSNCISFVCWLTLSFLSS